MVKKLYVRHATPADEAAIFDFYDKNPHAFIAKREPDIWRERIAAGAVTMIEDENGKILAAAIAYPVVVRDKDGNDVHKWTELGSMRIAAEGLGLFRVMLSMQVMQAYLLEPPEDRFAVEIIRGNNHSKHVFLREGAAPYDIPQALLDKVSYSISPDDPNLPVDWFQLGVENMPHFAQNIREMQKNPALRDKKTGEEYILDFSRSALVRHFGDAIDKIAASDYGDAAKPNPRHGLKSFRDKFVP